MSLRFVAIEQRPGHAEQISATGGGSCARRWRLLQLCALGTLAACARVEPARPVSDPTNNTLHGPEASDLGADDASVALDDLASPLTHDLLPAAKPDLATGKSDLSTPKSDLAIAAPPDLSVVTPPACALAQLRINEIETNGAGGASDEFVEIYNPCATSVALTAAKLVYRAAASTVDNNTFATFTGATIPAHGHFVVANSGFAGTADVKPFQSGGMAATAGSIALERTDGTIIDSLGWGATTNAFVEGTSAGAPGTGQSIARVPDGADTDQNLNDFHAQAPSPGAAN